MVDTDLKNEFVKVFSQLKDCEGVSFVRRSINETYSEMLKLDIWYGSLLSEMCIDISNESPNGKKVKTMAVIIDEKKAFPSMIVNPLFWSSVHLGDSTCGNTYHSNKSTLRKRIGLFKHEILHTVLKHHKRGRFYERGLKLNIAMDMEVNNFINKEELMENCILCTNYNFPNGMTFEWYYEHIKESKYKGSGENKSKDKNNSKLKDGEKVNSKDNPNIPDDVFTEQMLEDYTGNMIDNANKFTIRSNGKFPDKFVSRIKSLKKSVLNWRTMLRHFTSQMVVNNIEQTFRKPNRRIKDLYPSRRRVPKSLITVAVDTSGSITDLELSEFMDEIKMISNSYGGVQVIQADAIVQEVKELELNEINFDIKWKGRGGTSFQPAFDYCRKNGINCLVYFTDGSAPVPDSKGIQTVWVFCKGCNNEKLKGQKVFL